MNLSDTDAEAVVSTLYEKRCSGSDDLDLITWLSNKYRIGKSESRMLHDDFYRGFQQGADSVIPVIDGKATEPAEPIHGSTVYIAAYRLGQRSFTDEFARALDRHQPRGCLPVLCFLFLLLVASMMRLV